MRTTLATGSKGRTRSAAFTLVELSIVVFIIGILMAVSIPGFVRSYNGAVLSETARSFSTLCQFARIQAVSRQQNATLHIDVERQMFWVSQPVRNEDGDQEERSLKVIEFSNRVALITAVRQDQPPTNERQIEVTFYPNGTCDPVYIILQGTEKGRGLCAMIDPITIRATIYAVKL
jgi:prepilin-type N-terminal cleavage/methylation domain-containing protein